MLFLIWPIIENFGHSELFHKLHSMLHKCVKFENLCYKKLFRFEKFPPPPSPSPHHYNQHNSLKALMLYSEWLISFINYFEILKVTAGFKWKFPKFTQMTIKWPTFIRPLLDLSLFIWKSWEDKSSLLTISSLNSIQT